MKKQKRIHPKNTMLYFPINITLIAFLYYDRFKNVVPKIIQGLILAFIILIWISFIIGMATTEYIEIFKKESEEN